MDFSSDQKDGVEEGLTILVNFGRPNVVNSGVSASYVWDRYAQNVEFPLEGNAPHIVD